MSNQDAGHSTPPVRPDTMQDELVIPGRRVENGHGREGRQGDDQAPRHRTEHRHQDDGHAQKQRQVHQVRHVIRGYQRGVLAVVPAVLVGTLVATLAGIAGPLEGPAEWLMEWTPVPIATELLLHFSAVARPAALLGSFALLLLLGGLSSALTVPLSAAGPALATGVLLAGLLALGAPLGGPLLLLGTFYLLTLIQLERVEGQRASRWGTLGQSAPIVAGAIGLLALYRFGSALYALNPRRLYPYQPPIGLALDGLTPLVTPTDNFYVNDKVLSYPIVAASSWRLSIAGAVARPLEFDLNELIRRSRPRYVTMECVDNPVGGPLIGTALWQGVAVMELLRLAEPSGRVVLFEAADGYAESIPVAVLQQTDALLAIGMNGALLDRAHGSPARLLVPGLYGFKSVKWVQRLQLLRQPEAGSWAAHGWDELPTVRTTTRIDTAQRTPAGILTAGVAFAGLRGIRGVEVRRDGGPWMNATLGPRLSRQSWVQWQALLPGKHGLIEARAIDGVGHVQTGAAHGPFPDGASGWAWIRV